MVGTRQALPEDLTQLGFWVGYAGFFGLRGDLGAVLPDEAPKVESVLGVLNVAHHFGGGLRAEAGLPIGTVRVEPGAGAGSLRLSGVGDLSLGVAYDLAGLWGAGGYRPSVSLGVSLGLPTGAVARIGDPHGPLPSNLVSLGFGAFSAGARANLTQFVHPRLAVSVELSGQLPLGASELGLIPGAVLGASVGVLGVLPANLTGVLRASLEHRGVAHELIVGEVISSGGTALRLEAALVVGVHERLHLFVGGRVPVVQNVNGTQVVESFGLQCGLVLAFGGKSDEHDHGDDDGHGHDDDHGHDEHPHERQADDLDRSSHLGDHVSEPDSTAVRELATGGTSFPIEQAVVIGQVTVVDFWAEWCVPCRAVDQALRRLVAEHPDLVVQRVEVPTFDAPVALEHLEDVSGLPVIWIFDRTGQRVETLVGAPSDVMVERIEAVLTSGSKVPTP